MTGIVPDTSGTVSAPASSGKGGRFVFVDGLRGIAALLVVLFHLYENLRPAVSTWFPRTLAFGLEHGRIGVDIFFALSGFVIAHSLRDGERSMRYFGRFALRRSIRLDPPLWVVIFLELMLIRVSLMAYPSLGTHIPTFQEIVANMTYTQRFLGLPDVVPVFWTLTYEVQFYVFLTLSVIGLAHLKDHRRLVGWAGFTGMLLWSLALWLGVVASPLRGLFVDRWFQFALGVAAWMVVASQLRSEIFVAMLAVTSALSLVMTNGEHQWAAQTAVVTAAALAVAGRRGAMGTWLSARWLQFLGGISYSLYLIHESVGWRLISLIKAVQGPNLDPIFGSITYLAAIAGSVFAAWVLSIAIERPSLALAQRVLLPRRSNRASTATDGTN
jgi:peptidoglycan/LPS O-acetylase OafA/YrhL